MSRTRPLAALDGVKVSAEPVLGPVCARPPRRRTGQVHWRDTDLEDAELVRRAQTGDAWARAALYHRHSREIANLALRLVRDREVAADVLQDTFVTAFETLQALREPARARFWLRTIAVRHVQRRFRRRRMLRWLGIGPPPATVALEELALAEAGQEIRAQLERADRALAQLPERARLVWTLRAIEGDTLPEIAEACGVSLATVKRDLALAESHLRRAVDEEDVP